MAVCVEEAMSAPEIEERTSAFTEIVVQELSLSLSLSRNT